ncbi:MAG TPA: hypothetical protein VMW86_09010 [Dehalococcoidales bacterium]|nr:hypothetical protein [Dehalococcoidales bacterium]
MHKFEQNIAVDDEVSPRSVTVTTEIDGVALDMAKFNGVCFAVQNKLGADSGALTCYIAEGTNSTQFSDTMLATVTLAASTTADQFDTVELKAPEMSTGYRYVRLEVNPAAGTTTHLAAVAMRFGARFKTGSAL